MSITLASVFDDRNQALHARDRLIEAGVDGTQVRIEDNQEERSTSELRDVQTEARPPRRGFFAELFGLGDDDAEDSAGHYAEAVRRGSTVLATTLPDESRVSEVTEILEDCGAVDIDSRVEQWRGSGYERYDESAPMLADDEMRAERERLASHKSDVMPVVEEDLKVGKRQIESGRVRVHRRMLERPVEEQVTLREERAVVERSPVDRPASAGDLQAFEDETIELRETREEAVVEKTARVVEEVRVGTETKERTETVRDTLRRSDVEVESVDAADMGSTSSRSGMDEQSPPSRSGMYSGPNRRVANDATYRGPERRRVAMQ